MKKIYSILSISILCVIPLIFSFSDTFLNINSTESNFPTISAVAPTPPFLRGLNFGNTLDAPNEGDWGIVMEEEHFDLAKEAGFESIRIPVRFSTHAELTAPYTIDPVFMDRVAWAVDNALSRDMIAIVDMHHYEEIHSDIAGHRDRYLGMWEQIADYFQDYPQDLYFEFLNEPYGDITVDVWNELVQETYDIVRETNPSRTLVIGSQANNMYQLPYLWLPDNDYNIIVTYHYYTPWRFAILGEEDWYGTIEERAIIEDELNFAAQWAEDNNRPLLMGEFGSNPLNEMEQRVNWGSFVKHTAEARNICWTYWHFQELYELEAEAWHQELLDALMSDTPPPEPDPGNPDPITIPFEYSGPGEYFWVSDTLGAYINSWNLALLTINDVDFTNTYVSAANLPAKIDGNYYVHYVGYYSWGHFEAVGMAPEPPEPEPPEPEPDTEPPEAPTGLTATAISTTQINLNWNNNPESDLANYRVYRSNSATGTYSFIGQTTSSDYSDTGLSAGTTYYYRVSAVDISGNESPQTSYLSATTQSEPEPEPPEPEPEPEPPSGDYQSISTPFIYNGAGEFYWVTDNIDNFINSWNLGLLVINGVDYTNTWVSANSLPTRIDGYYYIHYVGNYPWSHFEAR